MNNVVTINQKKFLSGYSDSQKTKGVPEALMFFGGVFLWMLLPTIAYINSGGPLSVSVFTIVGSVGILVGLISYRYPAPKPPSIIGPGSVKQSPDRIEPPQKKAA